MINLTAWEKERVLEAIADYQERKRAYPYTADAWTEERLFERLMSIFGEVLREAGPVRD